MLCGKHVPKRPCHPVLVSLRLPTFRKLSYVAPIFIKFGHTPAVWSKLVTTSLNNS
jgi:hypothetical protein